MVQVLLQLDGNVFDVIVIHLNNGIHSMAQKWDKIKTDFHPDHRQTGVNENSIKILDNLNSFLPEVRGILKYMNDIVIDEQEKEKLKSLSINDCDMKKIIASAPGQNTYLTIYSFTMGDVEVITDPSVECGTILISYKDGKQSLYIPDEILEEESLTIIEPKKQRYSLSRKIVLN